MCLIYPLNFIIIVNWLEIEIAELKLVYNSKTGLAVYLLIAAVIKLIRCKDAEQRAQAVCSTGVGKHLEMSYVSICL